MSFEIKVTGLNNKRLVQDPSRPSGYRQFIETSVLLCYADPEHLMSSEELGRIPRFLISAPEAQLTFPNGVTVPLKTWLEAPTVTPTAPVTQIAPPQVAAAKPAESPKTEAK